VGVIDQADHGGAHRGDGGGQRQVTEYPAQAGGSLGSWVVAAGEVEVRPPGAEADHDRDQSDGEGRPGDEQLARAAVLRTVAPRGQQPQAGQHREQDPRGRGEPGPARPACLRDEGAHRDEHQDLQQERTAGAGVLVAVQFMVQAAVGPGDPHQREHRGELAEPGPRQVQGQPVGGLGD
jgi:hypothetical protein